MPLREWVKKRNAFLGELISCGYCFGLWVAFGLVAIYRLRLFEGWWFLDYFFASLAIAWLSALQWVLMCWLNEKGWKVILNLGAS